MASAIKLKNQVTKLEAAKKAATKGKNTKLAAKFQSQIEVLKGQIKALNKPTGSPAVEAAKQLAREYKAKYGVAYNGIDIEKDAIVPAMKTGRRVSQGIKGNQFASKGEAKGNVYYEYRENRIDRNAKRYPKLADGGVMAKGGVTYEEIFYPTKESVKFKFNVGDMIKIPQIGDRGKLKKVSAKIVETYPAEQPDGTYYPFYWVVGEWEFNKDEKHPSLYNEESIVLYGNKSKYADGGSLDSILLDTGAATTTNIGGTFYSNANLSSQMDITDPMFEHGGEIHRGEGGSMFAKGGMTQHGLKRGDEIIDDQFWDNSIVVRNRKDGTSAVVQLSTGKRTESKM